MPGARPSHASGGPMTEILQGVRILEVAEHTFVPAASAMLADLGADVIKIEHVERGDAMRGLASTGMAARRRRRARAARALQPWQAEPRTRPDVARWPRHPVQGGGDRRRVPHQQAPERPREARRSASSRSGPPTRHHLRPGHRPGRAGSRCRQGLLRLARVLGSSRCRHGRNPPRVRRTDPAAARPRASATRSGP